MSQGRLCHPEAPGANRPAIADAMIVWESGCVKQCEAKQSVSECTWDGGRVGGWKSAFMMINC